MEKDQNIEGVAERQLGRFTISDNGLAKVITVRFRQNPFNGAFVVTSRKTEKFARELTHYLRRQRVRTGVYSVEDEMPICDIVFDSNREAYPHTEFYDLIVNSFDTLRLVDLFLKSQFKNAQIRYEA